MESKHYSVAVVLALVVSSATIYLNSVLAVPSVRPPEAATADLSEDRYLSYVRYLASDELKGRGDGTPELDEAADYITTQFHALGLRPKGEDGTYFQTFPITTGAEFGPSNDIRIDGRKLQIKEDFVPVPFSTTGTFEGPVVFVGYGITAPEYHYDDYAGIDVDGKAVVVFRHEPQELDPKSVFNGTNFTTHAAFISKAINAKQHGAKAIIFITDPNNHVPEPDKVGEATRGAETDDVGISSIHARREAVMELFKRAGQDLGVIQKEIDTKLQPHSFELATGRVRIVTDIVRTRKPVRNIVGAIKGADPRLKDDWVVIGAHYDHLGLGSRNSLAPSQIGKIHHGADDNASGTAGVIELARLAAKNPGSFKRSVLFVAFAGEEIGLLGSSYFVNHPTVPLANITGMINLDMIGRVKANRIFVEGVGTSPNLRPWLEDMDKFSGLRLDYSNSGYGGSDHMSFTMKKIPVMFFFSGLHSDYHKPSDTADKINAHDAVRVLSLVYMMMEKVADAPQQLQYTEVQQAHPSGGGGDGYGPYFGSIPDFRDDLMGVLFADIQPNSPAAKAGLKSGDLLIEFGGMMIDNLYDFTYALRAHKPGDVVQVIVRRQGQEVRARVTLEPRK